MADTAAVLADHELILAERHAEISAKLGIPIGSIGPSRSHCLARLRRHPAIAELIDANTWPMECEDAS